MSDGLLLIPGFLGFSSFGRGAAQISYFDHVAHAIQATRPDLKGWIDVSRPPPTGSLASRVQNLHDTIADVLENGMGKDPTRKPDRLHLVGHSTGGLDARLLVNSRYPLPGADTRNSFTASLGTIVTVSAPLSGTPIANRLAGAFKLSLPALFLLSIAAKAREVALRAGWPEPSLGPLIAMLTSNTIPDAEAIRLLLNIDATTASEIAQFLASITQDGKLIDDLKPSNMAALNHSIGAGDTTPLRTFVTVAPAPSLTLPDLLHPLTSLAFHQVYAVMHAATADSAFVPSTFPSGPWLPSPDAALAADGPLVNDGVVPSASQTLDGKATCIVVGDHLDVVGHYDSQRFPATRIFESDAGFDDTRFSRLWAAVAHVL